MKIFRRKSTPFCLLRSILHLGLRISHGSLKILLRALLGKRKGELIWAALPVLRKFSSLLTASNSSLPIILVKPPLLVLTSGETFFCPLEDAFIIEEIWRDEVYEKFFKVKRGSIVVDVGAHVGIFAIKASKKVGEEGCVIACEPHPTTYALLIANLKNNKCRNVIPLNIALSDFKGKAELYLSSFSGQHSLVIRRDRWIRVHVDTVDHILRKLNLKHVDFIKIDVEGGELQVMRGAKGVLKENGPILSIAAYHTSAEAKEISEFLTSKGKRVFSINSYIYTN